MKSIVLWGSPTALGRLLDVALMKAHIYALSVELLSDGLVKCLEMYPNNGVTIYVRVKFDLLSGTFIVLHEVAQ